MKNKKENLSNSYIIYFKNDNKIFPKLCQISFRILNYIYIQEPLILFDDILH